MEMFEALGDRFERQLKFSVMVPNLKDENSTARRHGSVCKALDSQPEDGSLSSQRPWFKLGGCCSLPVIPEHGVETQGVLRASRLTGVAKAVNSRVSGRVDT